MASEVITRRAGEPLRDYVRRCRAVRLAAHRDFIGPFRPIGRPWEPYTGPVDKYGERLDKDAP